jgi:thymidylate synthase (FAD)
MKVLDHGYVKLVEHWGSDGRIIEAARMSTQDGFRGWGPGVTATVESHLDSGKVWEPLRRPLTEQEHKRWSDMGRPNTMTFEFQTQTGYELVVRHYTDIREEPGDEKLLAYLWRNNHATPFEMAGVVFEIQAPIFVFREWHRHRTQSYNEMSARYAPLPDLNYIPTVERIMMNGGKNRQAGAIAGSEKITEEQALTFRAALSVAYARDEGVYQAALSQGVPKELARLVLPVGRYSRMRASANLRNWLGFLTLRMAPNAQWEIRQYANVVHEALAAVFPRTLALFDEGRAA